MRSVTVNLDMVLADTVAGAENGQRAAERRALHLVQVVHADHPLAVRGVQLDDDAVGQAGDGRRDAAGGRQVDTSVIGQFAGLDDGRADVAQEAGTDALCHLREMDVRIMDLAGVHRLAEVRIGGVGSAEIDAVGTCQRAVARVAGRGTGDDADLEMLPPLVTLLRELGQGGGHAFRGAGGCESAEAQYLSIFDEACRFGGSHSGIVHDAVFFRKLYKS